MRHEEVWIELQRRLQLANRFLDPTRRDEYPSQVGIDSEGQRVGHQRAPVLLDRSFGLSHHKKIRGIPHMRRWIVRVEGDGSFECPGGSDPIPFGKTCCGGNRPQNPSWL